VLKSLLAGGVAGMAAKSTVAPLDRVKILLQAQASHYKGLGVAQCLHRIVHTENALALFKGNGAQMVRIFPYGALQFTTFEVMKQLLPCLAPRLGRLLHEESHSMKFIAGSLAGLTAVTITFPLDTIRARLAFQVPGAGERYLGIRHAGQEILRREGLSGGLYRGLLPTLLGIIPYAGLSFYSFELLKVLCLERVPQARVRQEGEEVSLATWARLTCGGMAGAFAQTASYPLDVARRRMQIGQLRGAGGWLGVLLTTYRQEGLVRGLFRGMSINYLRAVPMTAVSFTVYESSKQALGLKTAIKISM